MTHALQDSAGEASGHGGTPDDRLRVLLVDDQQLVRSGFALILSVEDDIQVVGQAADGLQAVALARELKPDVILMDVQMPVLDGISATAQIVAQEAARVIVLTTFDRDDYLFDALRAGASGFLLKNADPDQLVEAVRAVGHGHALLAPEVTRRVIAQMVGDQRGPVGTPSHPAPPAPVTPGTDAPAAPGTAVPAAPGTVAPARSGTVAPAAQAAAAPARPVDEASQGRLALLTERERDVLRLVAKGLSNAEIAKELFLGEATVKTHVSNCLAKLRVRDRVQAVVAAYDGGLVHPGE